MLKSSYLLLFFVIPFRLCGQQVTNSLEDLLTYIKGKNKLVDAVLSSPEKYRTQFIFSSIQGEEDSTRQFSTISQLTNDYFYPASMVKLPIAILVLEKLNRLGIDRDCFIEFQCEKQCGDMSYTRLSGKEGKTIEELLQEMIIISDNNSFNAFYHFLTPKEINDRLRELGFDESKIYKCFSGCPKDNQLYCQPLRIFNKEGKEVYFQAASDMEYNEVEKCFVYTEEKLIGLKHNQYGKIIPGPYDFNYNLEMPLDETHEMLQRLVFPIMFPDSLQWKINEDSRDFLVKTLSQFPSELKSLNPNDKVHYPENAFKYIYFGRGDQCPPEVKTISKIGISHGFTTESAVVVDSLNNVVFQLSVSIYTNANNTVNDGKYEYEQVAKPFIAEFSKLVYAYYVEEMRE